MAKKKVMHCGVCDNYTPHRYDGVQKFPKFKVKLWTCEKCGATQSVRR